MDNRDYAKETPVRVKQIMGNTAWVLLWTYTGFLIFLSFFTRYFWGDRQEVRWVRKPRTGLTPYSNGRGIEVITEKTHDRHVHHYDGINEFWPITDGDFFSAFSLEEFVVYLTVPWIVIYQLKKGLRSDA